MQDRLQVLKERIAQPLAWLTAHEDQLKDDPGRQGSLFERFSIAFLSLDGQGVIQGANRICLGLLGYEPAELIGRGFGSLLAPKWQQSFQQALERLRDEGSALETALEPLGKDGSRVSIVLDCRANRGARGELQDLSCILRPTSWLSQSVRPQGQAQEGLEQAFEDLAIGMARLSLGGRIEAANKAFYRLLGYEPEQVLGRRLRELIHPRDRLEALAQKQGLVWGRSEHVRLEQRYIQRSGEVLYVILDLALVRDPEGRPRYLWASLIDITERKEMEQGLRYLSLNDALTGLYNRVFFEAEFRRLNDARYLPLGIIVADIDGMKVINDALGHSKGDELLRAAAKILRRSFRRSDILARIGGDEFAVLLPNGNKLVVEDCRRRLREELSRYNARKGHLSLSLSSGSAVQYQSPLAMAELFKRADDDMYKEKINKRQSIHSSTIQALIATMQGKDYSGDRHNGQVQDLARHLASQLGLKAEQLAKVRLLARFYNLGKVGVSKEILFKPGPLSTEEFQEIKRHCELGYRIARSVSDLSLIAEHILKHHEWWNGKGYPLGLKGEEIPIESRIIAVCAAYTAMINDRPYRQAVSPAEALAELRRCSGSQFDPRIVKYFVPLVQGPS